MATARNSAAQTELPLRDPLEPRVLPRNGSSFWTLNRLKPGKTRGMEQRPYRLHQMEWVLANVGKGVDTYMSQAFFSRPCRRALHLSWITHAYVDLDLYKLQVPPDPGTAGFMLRLYCRDEGIPEPSVIVSSGRGIYLKWMWSSPLPRAAAGRFVAVNKALVRRFTAWGADPAAVDVSRILRVVGTTNTKSGTRAQVLWQAERDSEHLTYDFDLFADEVLPYTLEQVRGFRRAAEDRRAELHVLSHERERCRVRHEAEQGRKGGQKAFCREDWAWGVVEDLRTLAKLRHGGIVPRGEAAGEVGVDLFGFHGACQLAQVIPEKQLWHEIQAWGRLILPADYVGGAFKRHCGTLLNQARRAATGETVQWHGRAVSPVYGHAKNTIIEQLRIAPDEMIHLSRLIDLNEKRRRDREATMATRRAQEVQERAEWLAEHGQERQRPWVSEGISRATWFRRQQTTTCCK